jgi:hypothetical protein
MKDSERPESSGDRPKVHGTYMGGLYIDPNDLFTTAVGRREMQKAIDWMRTLKGESDDEMPYTRNDVS